MRTTHCGPGKDGCYRENDEDPFGERPQRSPLLPRLAPPVECTGCATCADACPHSALAMVLDAEGFAFPRVLDPARCRECGLCQAACPVLHPAALEAQSGLPLAFAGWSLTPEYRRVGSSGGVFAEVAAHTISSGGSVAGAVARGLGVRHELISTLDGIRHMQGSKYLQSETAGIYSKVLAELRLGRRVLFSGTPCQVAGIRRLASGRSVADGLLTAEVICLGVPSRRFWDRYVLAAGPDVEEVVSFRDKQKGWGNSLALTLRLRGSERQRRSVYADDAFLRAFFSMLIFRNCCYDCRFAAIPRVADISLADFHGLRRHPEEHFGGVSLVLANTSKGLELLRSIPSLALRAATWEEALPDNPRVYEGESLLPWRGFIARRLLARALRCDSFSTLSRFYGNVPKGRMEWWPYRLALRCYAVVAKRRRKALYRERTAGLRAGPTPT